MPSLNSTDPKQLPHMVDIHSVSRTTQENTTLRTVRMAPPSRNSITKACRRKEWVDTQATAIRMRLARCKPHLGARSRVGASGRCTTHAMDTRKLRRRTTVFGFVFFWRMKVCDRLRPETPVFRTMMTSRRLRPETPAFHTMMVSSNDDHFRRLKSTYPVSFFRTWWRPLRAIYLSRIQRATLALHYHPFESCTKSTSK